MRRSIARASLPEDIKMSDSEKIEMDLDRYFFACDLVVVHVVSLRTTSRSLGRGHFLG